MFATTEDAWEFTMVPRLLAAGADLDLVGRVQVEDDGIITGLTTPVDVPALRDLHRRPRRRRCSCSTRSRR